MSEGKSKIRAPHRSSSRSAATRPQLKVLSSKTVFKGLVFHVTRDRVQEPNGITAMREVIRHSGSVVVLAVDDSGPEPRVLLERQYRYAAQDYLLELPAGRIDPGEDPLAAGKRELLEETGYTARSWKRMPKVYLVGAGPGDPGLITVRGRRALEQADAVLYDNLASEALLGLAPASAERRYVGKKKSSHAFSQD